MRPNFMKLILLAGVLSSGNPSSATAHHPDRRNQPVTARVDVIGPVGNRLPMSHRRRYNRPTDLAGKVAYHFAPSSLEAMAWHDATHRGAYECNRPRTTMHYFYPKPWEVLPIGRRPSPSPEFTPTVKKAEDVNYGAIHYTE